MNWYKRLVVLLAVTAFTSTMLSCYGSFGLTKKVYKFNGGLGGPLVKTVVFWALLIVPVYEIAFTADFFVLNVLEALTGSNPLAKGEVRKIEKDGIAAEISSPRPGVLVVKTQGMVIEATESGAVMTDESGALLGSLTPNSDGSATLKANGVVTQIPVERVNELNTLTEQALAGEKTEPHLIDTIRQTTR